MTNQAEALGFTYSRKGCPCNGLNLIYRKTMGNSTYQLTIWPNRNVWQLKSGGCLLTSGDSSNLTQKIKSIWDL